MADAEQSLRKLIDTILDKLAYVDHKVTVKAINSGGANYTSALYLVTVSAAKCEDLNLFAKVAIVGEKLRGRMNADVMYTTERFVYTKLIDIYEGLYDKYGIPNEHRLLFPKFYGCNPNYGEETVVLEDLVADGFSVLDRFKSMDWEHAANAVEALAKFHALSFAYEKENPSEFQKTIEEREFKAQERDEILVEIWKNMIRGAIEVTKDEYKLRLAKFLESEGGKYAQYHHPIGKPVLVHGDFRLSNILFKKQGDKLLTIPVDYQTVHSGCPATDLTYFIFMGSDRQFRKQHFRQLVDYYHQQLTLALQRFHLDAEAVYSKETFDNELREMQPYALILGVVILPVVTVETESAPKVDGEADLRDFVVKPNELFAERFGGIVEDCVEWGLL